jgi:hypothetical protein
MFVFFVASARGQATQSSLLTDAVPLLTNLSSLKK